MRIAILSDIHGNPLALDAVLADIAGRGGVDAYWFLGDYAAIGYDPVTPLERIAGLPGAVFTRGNTDRYIATGERPPPSVADAQANPARLPTLISIVGGFAWTQGYVTAAGWRDWLVALPLEHRATLPDGTRVLLVHAAPGKDEGAAIRPGVDEADLRALLAGCDADLVCVGHTHWPFDQTFDGVRVINTGSVSNPLGYDLRASYVLLTAGADGYRLDFQRVPYDVQAVIAAIKRSGHASADYVAHFFRGEYRPSWGIE